MSQNDKENLSEILNRIKELEDKMYEYERCRLELEELKDRVDEIIKMDFAPINTHIKKWDERDLYLFRAKMFLKRYIYTPIHIGVRTGFFIAGKLILTLATGIVAGIMLNMLGIGNFFKTIIDFFSKLFNQ